MSVRKTHNAYVAWGDVILRRLDESKGLGTVVLHWRDLFRKVHTELTARNDAVNAAFSSRHAQIAGVGDAGAQLDAALDRVLDLLPAAGLGDRRNPLRNVSTMSASDLARLGNARLAEEIATIVTNIRAKIEAGADTKDETLGAAVDLLGKRGAALAKSVEASGAPADAYHQSVHLRDELLVDWQTTLTKLRRRVDTHFEDTPARAAEIFAPPEAGEADQSAANVGRATKTSKKAEKQAERAAVESVKAAVRDAAKAKKKADKTAEKAAKVGAAEAAKSAKAAAKVAEKATRKRRK